MATINWRQGRFQDWINLVLGLLVAACPWMLGYTDNTLATQISVIGGLLVAVVSVLALLRFNEWEEWVNLIAGLGIALSPFVLGLTGRDGVTAAMTIGGLMILALAAWDIWDSRSAWTPRI